jgi:hypothetical protein
MKQLLVLTLLLMCTACAIGPQPYLNAAKPPMERQQDIVACQAIAAQSAAGTGSWSRDPAIRAAINENARENYLAQCLQSRGWSWTTP